MACELSPELVCETVKTCDIPCESPCKQNVCEVKEPCSQSPCSQSAPMGYTWGWLGSLIIWFIIFTVLFWLVYFSLKPSFVLQEGCSEVNTSKVLFAAVLSALVIVVVVWLVKLAIGAWN